MGFNNATQRGVSLGGAVMEFGEATFVADQAYIDIPTRLTTIFAGGGNAKGASTETGTLTQAGVIYCDNTVESGGTVKFWRKGPYYGDAAVVNYWVIGL